jgi:peptidoglycan hydrolase-like protein with peptidoglycan-binding domain
MSDIETPEDRRRRTVNVTVEMDRLDLSDDDSLVRGRHVANLQGLLKAASVDDDDNPRYDPGPIDGIVGRRTRRAVVNFKTDHGLADNPIVGRAAWERLIQD